MNASDIRAKTADELKDDLASLKKEQFNLRFQRATQQLCTGELHGSGSDVYVTEFHKG